MKGFSKRNIEFYFDEGRKEFYTETSHGIIFVHKTEDATGWTAYIELDNVTLDYHDCSPVDAALTLCEILKLRRIKKMKRELKGVSKGTKVRFFYQGESFCLGEIICLNLEGKPESVDIKVLTNRDCGKILMVPVEDIIDIYK